MLFTYIMQISDTAKTEAVVNYAHAMGLLAKNDIHFRFEPQILLHLYNCLKSAILNNQPGATKEDWAEIAYQQIGKMLTERDDFDRLTKLCKELELTGKATSPLTLTEVLSMKNYCGVYFMTLAARYHQGKSDLLLVPNQET